MTHEPSVKELEAQATALRKLAFVGVSVSTVRPLNIHSILNIPLLCFYHSL